MTKEELKQQLIELLDIAVGDCNLTESEVKIVANYLIDNGVTIRERGEWICKFISTFPQYEPDQYCCSNCGCIKNFCYNFCPNCGADLRGVKDEFEERNI